MTKYIVAWVVLVVSVILLGLLFLPMLLPIRQVESVELRCKVDEALVWSIDSTGRNLTASCHYRLINPEP